MCNGFGMIITKELKGYFCEPDTYGDCSHSETIKRLGIKENENQFIRNFVRVQCPNWKIGSFEFDEQSTLPGWAEENREEIVSMVGKMLKKAYQALAEYKKVSDTALAEYKKVLDPAWAEYKKVSDTAWAEYKKVSDTALAEYEKVRDQALAEFIQKLSTIPGYVGKVK
jgi:hypothetical protein